jgi:hypothetical protein
MIQPQLRETTPQRMNISIARRFFASSHKGGDWLGANIAALAGVNRR